MKRTPASSTRKAPSPRTASEISGCWPVRRPDPSHITVGWNCTNSRSRSTAPARSASAIPSPVATAGLVVAENTWPIPPLASTTARHRTAPTPSRWPSPITCRVTPASAAALTGDQVEDQRVLDDLDLGRGGDGGHQRPLDLGAGRVAAGVGDPVAEVPALAGQRQLPGRRCGRTPCRGDELAYRGRPLGHQRPHRVLVAHPGAGDQGVVQVLLGGVRRVPGRRRCRPAPTGWSRPRAGPW